MTDHSPASKLSVMSRSMGISLSHLANWLRSNPAAIEAVKIVDRPVQGPVTLSDSANSVVG